MIDQEQSIIASFLNHMKLCGNTVPESLLNDYATFKFGYLAAVENLKSKHNFGYTDIVSDGGFDLRN